MCDKPIVLFGAGKIGQYALTLLGDKVAKFCDNNPTLHGTIICGKEVVSLDDISVMVHNYRFVITVRNIEAILAIERQLKERGADFEIFDDYELKFDNSSEAFSYIYRHNLWGKSKNCVSQEKFFSGNGSHKSSVTAPYMKLLKTIMYCNNIQFVTEIGCGDFWLMRQVMKDSVSYVGIDVVDELIDYNQTHFGTKRIRFMLRDAADEQFDLPPGDLLIIRQVLQHLDNKTIKKIMEKTAIFKYVLVTEHIYKGDDVVYNLDKPINDEIRLYKKSGVYLDKPPYNYQNIINLCEVNDLGGVIRTSLIINTLN